MISSWYDTWFSAIVDGHHNIEKANDSWFKFQNNPNHHMDEQDELNDIQIRLPPLRSSRSSLNAVDNVNNKSNNTLTVTQAVVSASTPSTTPETDMSSKTTQSTSTGAQSPVSHQPGTNVVRISTL